MDGKNFSVEQVISQKLLDLGVPVHLKGFRYLRTAVELSQADMNLVGSITKLLYPEVAKRYHITEGKVERAIRNAIEISWSRGNIRTFDILFGYTRENGHGRPTNSEYIAAVADAIRMERNGDIKRI